MGVEFFKFWREAEEPLYKDISPEKVTNAKKYLQLIADGAVHSMNIDSNQAKGMIVELDAGKMPDYAILGHATDYVDFLTNERS